MKICFRFIMLKKGWEFSSPNFHHVHLNPLVIVKEEYYEIKKMAIIPTTLERFLERYHRRFT